MALTSFFLVFVSFGSLDVYQEVDHFIAMYLHLSIINGVGSARKRRLFHLGLRLFHPPLERGKCELRSLLRSPKKTWKRKEIAKKISAHELQI